MIRWLVALLLFSLLIRGKAEITVQDVKRSVAFIFEESDGKIGPVGTGFWVAQRIPNRTNDVCLFLVTAKHVIAREGKVDLSTFGVRINTKDGKSRLTSLRHIGHEKILLHQNENVDLAAIAMNPKSELFEYKAMLNATNTFVTRDDFDRFRIEEGDDVLFAGLFRHFVGDSKNVPFFRFGKLSTTEYLRTRIGDGGAEFLLAEAQGYPGFSGSPVFVKTVNKNPDILVVAGGSQLRLIGLLTGFLSDRVDSPVVEVGTVAAVQQNTGMALITPIEYLSQLLNSAQAKALLRSLN